MYGRRRSVRVPAAVKECSRSSVCCWALLIAGQKALGRRFASHARSLRTWIALGIIRSHFHHEYPKGTHCCVRCTLAAYLVLKAGAIRYFDCAPLADQVRRIVRNRQWRFARPVNAAMVHWSLGDAQ